MAGYNPSDAKPGSEARNLLAILVGNEEVLVAWDMTDVQANPPEEGSMSSLFFGDDGGAMKQ